MAHIFSLLHVHCKKQFRYLPMSSFLSRLRRHKLLLAKVLGYRFIDSDLEIQSQEGKRLPELIEEFGKEGFLDIEARVNASIEAERCVIATGGSVVYRDSAMQHLKEIGMVVYLKLTCEELEERLGDLRCRGVALQEGQTLQSLYEERIPLYEKYADITVDETNMSVEETMEQVVLQYQSGK